MLYKNQLKNDLLWKEKSSVRTSSGVIFEEVPLVFFASYLGRDVVYVLW